MGQLTGKTALVTGGSSGIGLATAQRFAAEGAHVFLTGRNQENIDKAVASIGGSATGIRSDVSDDRDLDKVFDAIDARGQGLDVVFANAGGGEFATLDDVTREHFQNTFNINVGGALFTVQKVLPLLKHGASIILTGSTAASEAGRHSVCTPHPRPRSVRSGRTWAGRTRRTPDPGQHPGAGAGGDARTQGPGAAGQEQALLDGEAAKVPMGRIGGPRRSPRRRCSSRRTRAAS